MARIDIDPRLPISGEYQAFKSRFYDIWKALAIQLNGLSEGRGSAFYGASTAAPTTGTWAQGDVVRNSAPAELGTAGSKYVIHGWQCTVSGTPGTWVQMRYLTGN